MGKGAILMAAAYPNRTSPVLRGKFILQYIEGVPPANPPPNVPTLDEKDIGTTKALTVREMMAKHRSAAACSSCHSVMDPLGFALENFDATGAWRDRDRFAGTVIDSAGELPDGTPLKGPDDLRKALLRRPDQFVQTLTEKLLTYSTGRTSQRRPRSSRRADAISGARPWSVSTSSRRTRASPCPDPSRPSSGRKMRMQWRSSCAAMARCGSPKLSPSSMRPAARS